MNKTSQLSPLGFFSNHEESQWSCEERSHFYNSYIFTSTWRVSPDLKERESLRRAQAELGLLFGSGYTTADPETLDVAQLYASEARSLFEACELLGIRWVARISDHFEGAIGDLSSESWGLLIEGEEGESRESLIYYKPNRGVIYFESLPKLDRPKVISASIEERCL